MRYKVVEMVNIKLFPARTTRWVALQNVIKDLN